LVRWVEEETVLSASRGTGGKGNSCYSRARRERPREMEIGQSSDPWRLVFRGYCHGTPNTKSNTASGLTYSGPPTSTKQLGKKPKKRTVNDRKRLVTGKNLWVNLKKKWRGVQGRVMEKKGIGLCFRVGRNSMSMNRGCTIKPNRGKRSKQKQAAVSAKSMAKILWFL